MSSGSTANTNDDGDLDIQSLLCRMQCNGPIHEITAPELDRLLQSVVSEDQVNAYMTSSSHFRSPLRRSRKYWTCIPTAARREKDLFQPYTNLFKDVLNYFNLYNPDQRILTMHKSDTAKGVPVLSAISINEEHFQAWDAAEEDYNFKSCVTPVEIKLKGGDIPEDEAEKYLAQCATYVEKIWACQPGRRWIYIPIFTRSHVQLLQFDRVGILRSSWIEINKRPDLLVRMILLTLGQSAVALGAHPSFTYDKAKMFITVAEVKYETMHQMYDRLNDMIHVVRAWAVVDEEGNERAIKWSWIKDRQGYPLETKAMEMLKGRDGVVQMIAQQENYHMLENRPVKPDTEFEGNNMMEILVVMELYGKSIDQFNSPMEFLCALKDAVVGIQSMWEAGIVHRQIRLHNILIGKPGAPVGSRGVIISMKHAAHVPPGTNLPNIFPTLGPFQAVSVLRGYQSDNHRRIHHDYREDLQSIVWIFLWIVLGTRCELDSSGVRPAFRHRFKVALAEKNINLAIEARRSAIWMPDGLNIHPSYPHQFNLLKTRMLNFFADQLMFHPKSSAMRKRERLLRKSRRDFATFLEFFDEAIEDLENGVIRGINGRPLSPSTDSEEEEHSGDASVATEVVAQDTFATSPNTVTDVTAQPEQHGATEAAITEAEETQEDTRVAEDDVVQSTSLSVAESQGPQAGVPSVSGNLVPTETLKRTREVDDAEEADVLDEENERPIKRQRGA